MPHRSSPFTSVSVGLSQGPLIQNLAADSASFDNELSVCEFFVDGSSLLTSMQNMILPPLVAEAGLTKAPLVKRCVRHASVNKHSKESHPGC